MGNVSNFSDYDAYVLSAREYFRSHASDKKTELAEVVDLFFDLTLSIGKSRTPVEWGKSKEEDTVKVLIKSMQAIFSMYYLSESGFYNLALALKRNFTELLMVAIAIGYDDQCYIDWKNDRSNFRDMHNIASRLAGLQSIPDDPEKKLIPILSRYWNESSSLHSHQITKSSINEGMDAKAGDFHLGVRVVTEEFQGRRLNTLRNMCLNVIAVLLGVFEYDELIKDRAKYP